jgi:hypothetical protein
VRRFLWVFFCGLAGFSSGFWVYLGALFAYFNKVFLLIKKNSAFGSPVRKSVGPGNSEADSYEFPRSWWWVDGLWCSR